VIGFEKFRDDAISQEQNEMQKGEDVDAANATRSNG
jgi:hypothetical protein